MNQDQARTQTQNPKPNDSRVGRPQTEYIGI